jgi:hypothetical protein
LTQESLLKLFLNNDIIKRLLSTREEMSWMYKYQCSKIDCSSTWTLNEGKLNGFVLTCPICSKGRGIFISQTKREIDQFKNDGFDEMVISVNANSAKSVEALGEKIDEFIRTHSLTVSERNIESTSTEVICRLLYKA